MVTNDNNQDYALTSPLFVNYAFAPCFGGSGGGTGCTVSTYPVHDLNNGCGGSTTAIGFTANSPPPPPPPATSTGGTGGLSSTSDSTAGASQAASSFSSPNGVLRVSWVLNEFTGSIAVTMVLRSTEGWMSVGLSRDGSGLMANADMMTAWIASGSSSNTSSHTVIHQDGWGVGDSVPISDTARGGTDDLTAVTGSLSTPQAAGAPTETTISFTRKLNTGDSNDVPFTNAEVITLWAYSTAPAGTNPAEYPSHTPANAGTLKVNWFSGAATALPQHVDCGFILCMIVVGVSGFVAVIRTAVYITRRFFKPTYYQYCGPDGTCSSLWRDNENDDDDDEHNVDNDRTEPNAATEDKKAALPPLLPAPTQPTVPLMASSSGGYNTNRKLLIATEPVYDGKAVPALLAPHNPNLASEPGAGKPRARLANVRRPGHRRMLTVHAHKSRMVCRNQRCTLCSTFCVRSAPHSSCRMQDAFSQMLGSRGRYAAQTPAPTVQRSRQATVSAAAFMGSGSDAKGDVTALDNTDFRTGSTGGPIRPRARPQRVSFAARTVPSASVPVTIAPGTAPANSKLMGSELAAWKQPLLSTPEAPAGDTAAVGEYWDDSVESGECSNMLRGFLNWRVPNTQVSLGTAGSVVCPPRDHITLD